MTTSRLHMPCGQQAEASSLPLRMASTFSYTRKEEVLLVFYSSGLQKPGWRSRRGKLTSGQGPLGLRGAARMGEAETMMAATRRVIDFMVVCVYVLCVVKIAWYSCGVEVYRKWFCVLQRSSIEGEWTKKRRVSKRFPGKMARDVPRRSFLYIVRETACGLQKNKRSDSQRDRRAH